MRTLSSWIGSFLLALLLIALPCAPAAAQDKLPAAEPAPAPAQTNPIAALAKRIGGYWKMTSQSGKSLYDSWHWGPGRHSLRVMTDGESASGDPWHAIQVIYRRPDLKQFRTLSMNPFSRSVAEGSVTFDGKTMESVVDMYQVGNRRKLVSRHVFSVSDAYHIKLLEEIDGRLGLLAEWDYSRSEFQAPSRPFSLEQPPRLPERLKALTPLLGRRWEVATNSRGEAKNDWLSGAAGNNSTIRSTFEWIPDSEGIYGRTVAITPDKDGGNAEPVHLLDTYLYHHTGANVLRCLALTSRGGVYEGDITVLDDGSLQADLKGYENDRAGQLIVRFDFEKDGTMRSRAWSVDGVDRSLLLDAHHQQASR